MEGSNPCDRMLCGIDLYHSSVQCQILNPLSKSRDWTHVLMDTSWICYRWAKTGTPILQVFLFKPLLGFPFASVSKGFSVITAVALLLQRHRLDPWPGNFCMPWVWQKIKFKKKKRKNKPISCFSPFSRTIIVTFEAISVGIFIFNQVYFTVSKELRTI